MLNLRRSILLFSLALDTATMWAQTETLRIEVYDYAALEPKILRQFLSTLEEILASSGLPVRVSLCRGSIKLSCDAGDAAGPIVRILPGEAKTMKNIRRPPLGQAIVGKEGGGYATVFVQASKEEAAVANVPWVVVLAHAGAHETGHLLLSDQAHTPRGLMKAAWDRSDYQDMAQKRLNFTDEQARKIVSRHGSAPRACESLIHLHQPDIAVRLH
jgi:hypothetical protein